MQFKSLSPLLEQVTSSLCVRFLIGIKGILVRTFHESYED